MECSLVYTDEFEAWLLALGVKAQAKVLESIKLLETYGATLPYPYSSGIEGSRIAMRELRIQVKGDPYRVLYAFDPIRQAVLLVGGDKTGNARWYKRHVPLAERLFEEHLASL